MKGIIKTGSNIEELHLSTSDFELLSAKERARIRRRHTLHLKYEEAVNLYADTRIPVRTIAKECGINECALRVYLQRYWRELMLRRHGIDTEGKRPQEFHFYGPDGQSYTAHRKYKDAVLACDSLQYIEFNISQVARKFGHNGTALANFMRVHYPDILIKREQIRTKLGINDNAHHGVRQVCKEQYAEALELYRTTDMSVKAVAGKCNVSEGGLLQHLRFYHRDILKEKREARRQAQQTHKKKKGALLGNGRKYEPLPTTVKKYAKALEMYKDTALTMKEIVRRTGVSAEGFRFYLHKWHRGLVLERSGIIAEEDAELNIRCSRNRMKTVAAKYAEAIESLKKHPRPVAQAAIEFGHHPDVFRNYIHRHEPELAAHLGLKTTFRKHPDSSR